MENPSMNPTYARYYKNKTKIIYDWYGNIGTFIDYFDDVNYSKYNNATENYSRETIGILYKDKDGKEKKILFTHIKYLNPPEKFWELNPIQYSTGENVAKNDIVRSKDELYRIKNIEKRGYEYTITLIDTDTKLEEKKYDVSDLIFMTNFPSIEGGKYRKHKRTYKRKNKRANKSRNRKSRRR